MRTIGEIRRLRLLQLMQELGLNFAEMNDRLGRTRVDSTLSQVVQSAPNSRTRKPRQMGDAQARLIEATLGKPEGWMDRDPEFDALLAKAAKVPDLDNLTRDLRAFAPPPPLYSPDDVLQALQTLLQQVPPEAREAVARTLDGWARDGGAEHWRRMLLVLLSGAEPGKRTGTHG